MSWSSTTCRSAPSARTKCWCSTVGRRACATPTSTSWRASTRTRCRRCSATSRPAIVEAVGSQVSYVQPGDHVISCISGFCGACQYCLSGRPEPLRQGRALGRSRRPAALAARRSAGVPVRRPVELRRATARAREPAREDPARHAARQGRAHRVRRHDRCRRGDEHREGAARATSVAVIGCGGIGLNAIQAAAIVGAGRIIAIDRDRVEARSGAGVRRHRRDRRVGRRSGWRGARAHRRRRRPRVRGDRPLGHRAAGVQHAAPRAAPRR